MRDEHHSSIASQSLRRAWCLIHLFRFCLSIEKKSKCRVDIFLLVRNEADVMIIESLLNRRLIS